MKETLRVSGKTIGISLLIYAIILIFRLHYVGIMALLTLLVCATKARTLYNKCRTRQAWYDLAKALLQTYVIVTIIYLLSWFLGGWGFFGSLLIILFIAAYKIFVNWKEFIKGLRDIETGIWGRPLERQYWRDRKPPKLRFTLTKGGGGKKMKLTKEPLHPVICWISLIAFVLIGALTLTHSILTALVALHSGANVGYFIGYLFGVFVIVMLVYILPVIMIATYLRHSRRWHQ